MDKGVGAAGKCLIDSLINRTLVEYPANKGFGLFPPAKMPYWRAFKAMLSLQKLDRPVLP